MPEPTTATPSSAETPSPALPRLLTAREVAAQTGLPLERIYAGARAGDLPHVRLGRAVRFPAPALRTWIAEGGTGEWTPPGSAA